jgi:hypothetical protein
MHVAISLAAPGFPLQLIRVRYKATSFFGSSRVIVTSMRIDFQMISFLSAVTKQQTGSLVNLPGKNSNMLGMDAFPSSI